MLTTLLTTRGLARGISRSTGNGRGDGPIPSNLLLSASDGLSAAELKAELLRQVHEEKVPYGIIVKRLGHFGPAGESFGSIRYPHHSGSPVVTYAVRIFPDGREEPVRVARLTLFNADCFEDILASSVERTVHTTTLATGTWPEPVSYVVPSLLFNDVHLRELPQAFAHPPAGPPPEITH